MNIGGQARAGAAALALLVAAGCGGAGADEPGDGDLGVAQQGQIDVGYCTVSQVGELVASAWRGAGGQQAQTELWAVMPSYQSGAGRAFQGGSLSCKDWHASVCGRGWTGATYYRTGFVETALDCASPPQPIKPPAGAVALLAPGSYQTSTSSSPFAWTYVTGDVEYWGMDHLVPTSGTSTQTPAPPHASLGQFVAALCQMNPAPDLWHAAYYLPVADFCAADPC